MAIDDISDDSGDHEILIIGKPVAPNTLPESIASQLRARGSLYDCRELSPTQAKKVDLYKDNFISFKQFKKGKWEFDRYPTSFDNTTSV